MGAALKQAAQFLAGRMAGSNQKATFLVRGLRTMYILSAGAIGATWYSGYRNERVKPGSFKFPFPFANTLKRQFKPDRPEAELPRDESQTMIGPNASGTPPGALGPIHYHGGLPTTPEAARLLPGLTHFEGKLVAAWIAPYLQYAKQQGWKGTVTQGFRTYAEEVSIYNSGVRPAAKPGTSNHGKKNFPGGAVDVTEAEELAHILSGIGGLLQWAGAKDPVHFSYPHNGSY